MKSKIPDYSSPTYDILHTTYLFKICNIFTLVGGREAFIVKREAERLIEILTGWILKAFLAIAPTRTGARMGTALFGDKGRSVPSDFLPNLLNFLENSFRGAVWGAGAHTREDPLFPPTLSLCPFGLPLCPIHHPLCPIGLSLCPLRQSLCPASITALSTAQNASPESPIARSPKRIRSLFSDNTLLFLKAA